jgi:hypothetical protein
MNKNKRLKNTGTLVSEIFAAHPEWNASQVYQRYLVLIGDTSQAVTLNAIQKHLEKLRIASKKIDKRLDAWWHLDDMKNDWMDAQSVSQIFRVWRWIENDGNAPYTKITNRQAKWISILYDIEYLKTEDELNRASLMCAMLERYYELTGTPYSSNVEYLFTAADITEYKQRFNKLLDEKDEIFTGYLFSLEGKDYPIIMKEKG